MRVKTRLIVRRGESDCEDYRHLPRRLELYLHRVPREESRSRILHGPEIVQELPRGDLRPVSPRIDAIHQLEERGLRLEDYDICRPGLCIADVRFEPVDEPRRCWILFRGLHECPPTWTHGVVEEGLRLPSRAVLLIDDSRADRPDGANLVCPLREESESAPPVLLYRIDAELPKRIREAKLC